MKTIDKEFQEYEEQVNSEGISVLEYLRSQYSDEELKKIFEYKERRFGNG